MSWYLVPYCTLLDVDGVSVVAYVPGYGIDPVRPLESLTGFIAQAALPRGSPTSALLGLERAPSVVPEGWTPQTLDEARATFEARVGRPPSPDEVF